ncbi:hypothetical protein ETD86_25100 [Nonomuraea turkmeniaca]|uniref:Uncharacterized protein n=1 Tax=Nonomuraea turkmeniaca TaxID=103838 RepID=A0A5S4FEN0_9ACTN|nr:hypothetical protein [Nonomuraea turkmeniaca]TMR16489.1 hypothetical protein ETD86_25100 [Nonomuraea turkmeniaca]
MMLWPGMMSRLITERPVAGSSRPSTPPWVPDLGTVPNASQSPAEIIAKGRSCSWPPRSSRSLGAVPSNS